MVGFFCNPILCDDERAPGPAPGGCPTWRSWRVGMAERARGIPHPGRRGRREPARTSGGGGIDLDKLVHRIVLDVILLAWFAEHGRWVAVVAAIAAARRAGDSSHESRLLDFLEQFMGDPA